MANYDMRSGVGRVSAVVLDRLGRALLETATRRRQGLNRQHDAERGLRQEDGPGDVVPRGAHLGCQPGMALYGADGAVLDGKAQRWEEGFLSTRCLTIAGGTSEVQRNVIAERLLGQPRDPEPGQ